MKALKLLTILFIFALTASLAYAGCGSCSSTPSAKSDDCFTCETAPSKHEHLSPCSHTSNKPECSHPHKTQEEEPAKINTIGLKSLLNSGVPLTLLDARSGKYDDGKRIPGAKSLNSKSTPSEILKVLPDRKALIVTYCSNLKCPASNKLYKHLKKLGYSNLIEYPQGIQGWTEAGNPITK